MITILTRMKLSHGSIIFTCLFSFVFCGVIDDSRTERDARDVVNLNENGEDCILGYEGPEAALLNIHDGFSNGGKKTKRCPRVGNPRLGNVVGESAPAQGDRKGLQKKFNEHICTSCRNAAPCKIHNNCGMCSNWCDNTDSTKQPDPSESVVGAPLQILPQYPPGIPTPFQTNVGFDQGEGNIVMESRSNMVGSTERKTFNVENNAVQPMKGIILRLLGMTDIGDADDMGIWITTNSNNPPIFENRNNAQKILSLCRDAGSELQEEAKEGAKDMVAFMWSQLHNELQNRLHQVDKNHMTKQEVGNMVQELFRNINLAQALKTPPVDDSQTRLEQMPQEFLPRYPVESQPDGFIMHQEMNPDIIEAPPNIMDQAIGAINENMLSEFDQNRGNADGSDIKINSRMNFPVENGALPNPNHMQGPVFGEPQSPSLEKIGASAIDFVKDVSQDVAKQGHKLNKMYDISLPKMETAERSFPIDQSDISKPSKSSDNFPLPVPAGESLRSNVNNQNDNAGSRTHPNEANWSQHPNDENSKGDPVDNRVPIDQNIERSEPHKQKIDQISRTLNRYKGKIEYPPSNNPMTNNMFNTISPRYRLSEPEDTGIILSENKEVIPDKDKGTLTDKTFDTQERVGKTQPQAIEEKYSDIDTKSQMLAEMDNDHSVLGTPSGQDIISQKETLPDNIQVGNMQPEIQGTEDRSSRTHKKIKKLKEKLHKNHHRQPPFYRANGNDNLKTFETHEEIIPETNVVGAPVDQSNVPSNSKLPIPSNESNQENSKNVQSITTNDVLQADQDSKSSGTYSQQSSKSMNENIAQRTFNEGSRPEKPIRKYDSIREALERLRTSTKNLNKEIITQPSILIDEDENNGIPRSGNPLQNSGNILENNVKGLPEVLLEKAEGKLSSAEKTLENLEENTNKQIENVLGSEPLENSLEMYAVDGKPNKMNRKIPKSEDSNVADTYAPPSENMDNLPSDTKSTNEDTVSLSNRMKSSEESVRWSDSLGSLVTGDGITINGPKDIFFVGNGIKLPLNMVKKNDGALHLSVNVDKLCGCKNETCVHNKTAIEETVGSILEKEAELKDQLEHASEALENRNNEDRAHTGSVPFETEKTEENGGGEGMRNSIASGFGPEELQHENPGILKRSAVDPKQDVEIINITPNNIYLQTNEKKSESHSTIAPSVTTRKSNFATAPTKTASEFFKDFWSKGVEDLSSRFSAMDTMLPLPLPINIFKNPLKDEVNTEGSIVVQKSSPSTSVRDSFNPLLIPQQILGTFLPTSKKTNHQIIPTPSSVFQRISTTESSSKMNSFPTKSIRMHNEQYDRVSKARGPYQFEGLHENLKSLDDSVNKANKENEKILKQGTEILAKANDEAAKQQIGIVDNFMNWLKGVGLRNEN